MFWSSAATSSNIETILDQPDVTLQTVLEQDEVLQELRVLNKKLVEFLSRPENLNGMIDLVTTEPSSELPLLAQYKLPNVACEVLTCENSFAEKITGEKGFLEKLFYFFRDKPSPINPLLSSYVCRVLGEMITRKLDQNWYSYQLNLIQIMGYLQSETGVLQWLLNHLDCSAVCEFVYKLIMNVEGQDMRNSLYGWMVDRERVIIRLMEKMDSKEMEDVHANVSRLVGDLLFAFQDEMINSSQERSTDADPFLQALRSNETISTLLNVIFAQDSICETSVMHGLDLLLALLGVTRRSPRQSGRNDSLDEENEGVLFSDVIKQEVLSRMPTLLHLLKFPVVPSCIPLTYGLLEKPVGLGRLAIAKFLAHLFTLNDDELNMGMIESGVLKQLLDLFWENPWNNFLHRYVCKILSCIAKASNSPGSASYLMDIGVLSKILEVFENKQLKCGYRGHLAKVASVWGECASIDSNIKGLMDKLEETDQELYTKWDVFYSDTLENYLREEKVLLAGVHPPASGGIVSSSSSSMPYETDPSGAMWQGFAAAASSLLHVDFDSDTLGNVMGGMDEGKARSLFEMFCNEKSNSLGDNDDDDDEDDGYRKKDSLDLGSPDDDSLEDDRWADHDHNDKLDLNLSNDLNLSSNLFASQFDDNSQSPTTVPTNSSVTLPLNALVGLDPWSDIDPSGDGSGGDPWSNNIIHSEDNPDANNITDAEWAKFDLNNETSPEKKINVAATTPATTTTTTTTGDDDYSEWASFESASPAACIVKNNNSNNKEEEQGSKSPSSNIINVDPNGVESGNKVESSTTTTMVAKEEIISAPSPQEQQSAVAAIAIIEPIEQKS